MSSMSLSRFVAGAVILQAMADSGRGEQVAPKARPTREVLQCPRST